MDTSAHGCGMKAWLKNSTKLHDHGIFKFRGDGSAPLGALWRPCFAKILPESKTS